MMNTKDKILVSIQCLVYNHEPYLRQCLEGFVMQKTNFRFEAIVHDDVSTDNSVAIIREYADKYPEIIKPIFETENQYSKRDGSLDRIMDQASKGKYIALCEGDDYWIDPYKLQKQVDFLEKNPDYGMVHSYAKSFIQTSNSYSKELRGKVVLGIDDLLHENNVATLTSCFRADLLKAYNEIVGRKPNWKMGDYPIWLYIASVSKIHFLKEVTAVYRILPNSAAHSMCFDKKIEFALSVVDIKRYFMEMLNRDDFSCLESDLYQIFSFYIRGNKDFNLKAQMREFHLKKVSMKFKLMNLISKTLFGKKLLKYYWDKRN